MRRVTSCRRRPRDGDAVPGSRPRPSRKPETNPFFMEWATPFGMAPFEKIKAVHFVPAFEAGIAERKKEIEAIASNPEAPTFANTVEALENGGLALSKVSDVFFTLSGADTNDEIQAINRKVAPLLSALRDDVRLNEKLFARVKAVWEKRDALGLTPEQKKLVDDGYKDFVRGGANLSPEQKKRFREVNQELSALGIRFGDNLLKETNAWRLVVEKKEDLAGLPPGVVAAAADAAKAAKLEGKWVFTLQAPSIWPFLTFAENRELRKEILTAYTTRCDKGGETDNKVLLVADSDPPRRAGEAPRLPDVGRLRPRRQHGEDAGEGLRASRPRLEAGSRGGEGRREGPRGRLEGRRQGRDARAVGLALLRREGPQGALRPRRPGAPPLLRARPRPRRGLLGGEPALRHHLHRADRRAEVPPRGEDVRGEGRRRLAPRDLHDGLPPAPRQARRRLVRTPARAVGEGRQGRPPHRHERHELHPARGRRSRRSSRWKRSRRSSTSSGTPSTGSSRASRTGRCRASRATSSSSPPRSWRTGRSSPRS